MVVLTGLKKADLVEVAEKLGLHLVSKDTKKLLIDKIEAFITENGDAEVVSALEVFEVEDVDGEDDASTLAEETEEIEDEVEETDDEKKGPPIDVCKYVKPVIEKIKDFGQDVGILASDFSEDLRENLSTVIALNYLELLFEALYFIYTYVPLVAVKHNNTIHPVFKEFIPVLASCHFKVPDITYILNYKVLSVALNWFLYSIILPLGVSYFVNFTRRSITISLGSDEDDEYDEDDEISVWTRVYQYDPFVFALVKVLVAYYITYNAGTLATLSSCSGIFKALETHFFIQLSFYTEFVVLLGNLPLVLGLANIVLGIYSQFEDL